MLQGVVLFPTFKAVYPVTRKCGYVVNADPLRYQHGRLLSLVKFQVGGDRFGDVQDMNKRLVPDGRGSGECQASELALVAVEEAQYRF
jgi:hypothetical protein